MLRESEGRFVIVYNTIVSQSTDWFGGSCCWVVLTQLILKSTMFAANTDLSGTVPMYADFGLLLLHEFLHIGKNKNKKGGLRICHQKSGGSILVTALARPETSIRGGTPKTTKAALVAPLVEVSKAEESMADSKNTSRTLGEDDSIRTLSIKRASFASLFASNRKLDNGIKLQQMHMEEGPVKIDEADHATLGCKGLEKFAAARNKGEKNQNAASNLAGKNLVGEDKFGHDIVELGSTSTSKEQQCKVKANGAKRAEARTNAENEKTKGNAVYFWQAQQVSSGELGLKIQQNVSQAKASQDKDKDIRNLGRKGTIVSSIVLVAPIPDEKTKKYRKHPGKLGNAVPMAEVCVDKRVTSPIAILSEVQSMSLIGEVFDKEIKGAVVNIGDDNALGPDGFSAYFFKKAWKTVGAEFCEAIKEFFYSVQLLKKMNHSKIALIPKL
ncbi:hypothetical protein Acr_22g0007730 [Actinidia rufa]|uniref:RNA-directed DNA polymerase, eukaryota, reverse transcriptase zinc-binding domain protein n=1 Tax=Actinidia rufa TaxID=165716 RepID=A0A7J0GKR9_9ERIC|nr:hypothetical protein Acr_22g0007730 [Actinidia rufa]